MPGKHVRVTGMDQLDKVVHVDQGPIGRTPRSNPATYTGVFRSTSGSCSQRDHRGEGARLPAGQILVQRQGQRCEACAGDGTIKIEMQFLPGVLRALREFASAPRYGTPDTLQVHYKGKSIAEVLDMPIEEAATFFEAVPAIRTATCKTLNEVGLGYVPLGQCGHHAVRRRGAARQALHQLQQRRSARPDDLRARPGERPARP